MANNTIIGHQDPLWISPHRLPSHREPHVPLALRDSGLPKRVLVPNPGDGSAKADPWRDADETGQREDSKAKLGPASGN